MHYNNLLYEKMNLPCNKEEKAMCNVIQNINNGWHHELNLLTISKFINLDINGSVDKQRSDIIRKYAIEQYGNL